MKRALFVVILLSISTTLFAEPVERHGISFSGGWTGLPSFIKKPLNKNSDTYINFQGTNLGVAYVYYGKGGPKGIFSGKFAFDYHRYTALPKRQDFVAENADAYMFDIAGIWTLLPSLPVNLYAGIGTGWAIVRIYNWDVTSPIADPEKVQEVKDTFGKYPLPFPVLYIPIGINFRIKNFILNVEAGIRDFPYLQGGFTYAFGKAEDVKIVKETIQIPPPPPDTGRIRGRVIEAETNVGLARAIIEMKGSGISDLSAGDDGSFITPELKSGEVELVVSKEGYTQQSVKVMVERGKTIETSIALRKEIQIGAIAGFVQNLEGKPLSATITVLPIESVPGTANLQPFSTISDVNTGEYMIKLKPGSYTVNVRHENYKPVTINAIVKQGFKTKVDFKLEPETAPSPPPVPSPAAPMEKKSRVYIEKEKIVITDTIYFVSGKANILPVSFAILDDIAELLSKNPEIHIRIEGHTDSVGNDSLNMKLSQARAESVMNYLIKKGIAPQRMEAKGYGETMPVADNSTPDGRAKNRRVEFVITKQ